MNRFRLQLEIWLHDGARWSWVVALILVVAALVQWQASTWPAQRRLDAAVVSARVVPASEPAPASARTDAHDAQTTLQAFEHHLADTTVQQDFQRRLWEQSAALGVRIARADYKRDDARQAGFGRLLIRMPLVGSYPAIKKLLFDLMAEFPSLGIEKMEFKRERVSSPEVQATIQFVLLTRP